MPKVKLLNGTHYQFENGRSVEYNKGDEFEANELEVVALQTAHPGRFEIMPDASIPTDGVKNLGPSMSMKAFEAIDKIETMETIEEIVAFTQGETRKSVQESAEDRAEALRPKE
jgi:hypothetical protein